MERNFRLMRQFSINDAMSCAAKWINRIKRVKQEKLSVPKEQHAGLLEASEASGAGTAGYAVVGHATRLRLSALNAASLRRVDGRAGRQAAQGADCTCSPCRNYRNYNER